MINDDYVIDAHNIIYVGTHPCAPISIIKLLFFASRKPTIKLNPHVPRRRRTSANSKIHLLLLLILCFGD